MVFTESKGLPYVESRLFKIIQNGLTWPHLDPKCAQYVHNFQTAVLARLLCRVSPPISPSAWKAQAENLIFQPRFDLTLPSVSKGGRRELACYISECILGRSCTAATHRGWSK